MVMAEQQWTFAELARIAHLQACRDLANRARSQVSTYGDGHRRGADLVEEARQVVGQAEEVMRLAVAAECAAGASWEQIGEALEVSRQSAHKRFAAAVDDIHDRILFPSRESPLPGGLASWACPDGVEDPDRTVQDLDAWALRHRERFDPDRGQRPVSEGLRRTGETYARVDAINMVTRMANRIFKDSLPQGVSDRTAQRMLLEQKLRAFDLIAAHDTGKNGRDASHQAVDVFAQLIAWHREDLDNHVTIAPISFEMRDINAADIEYESSTFLLDGAPIAELEFTAEGSPDRTGWFLLRIDPEARDRAPDRQWAWLGEPRPLDVADVDADALVTLGRNEGRDALLRAARFAADQSRPNALASGRRVLISELADERARHAAGRAPGETREFTVTIDDAADNRCRQR
jgi:hypothetical protein